MEYQKIINLLDNTPNQSSKFRAKIGLKSSTTFVKPVTLIVKSGLRAWC